MKSKTISLAALAAFTIAGPASAAILLTDNFNSDNQTNSTFNNTLVADQGGTLATISYTTDIGGSGNDNSAQHGNGANSGMLLAATLGGINQVYASLNHNFATDANAADQVLEIKFSISTTSGTDPSNWASIAISASQNLFVNHGGNKFSSLFRDNGGTQQFASGATVGDGLFSFTDGDLVTLTLSDTAGTGSAFDGNGSVAKIYLNNVLQNTWSNLGLGPNDGYISFQANGAFGHYDNLSIATIPEPQAALLGGLGMLALLRRRR